MSCMKVGCLQQVRLQNAAFAPIRGGEPFCNGEGSFPCCPALATSLFSFSSLNTHGSFEKPKPTPPAAVGSSQS